MGRTSELRSELKSRFLPFMLQKGFVADNRHAPNVMAFRKITADAVYACDIHWEKYGRPRFRFDFGKCCGAGTIVFEEHIRPSDVFSWQTPIHGTLAPGSHIRTSGWFRQDRSLIGHLLGQSRVYPNLVVAELMKLFAEIETFWNSGTIGPHIRVFTDGLVKDAL